jgi:hypothetical protein
MTTLVLQSVGAVVGGIVAGPVGAMVGRAIGGLAGAAIDSQILAGGGSDSPRHVEGPRLKDVDGLTSTEGAPIPRVYGRARIGGQLIWATRLEEVATTTVERSGRRGGKGLGGGGAPATVTTSYAYFANLAVGLCEGPIAMVRRVWADGREIDLTGITMRVHTGTPDQAPDPLIVAKEGPGNAPAYRGLAYAVFERLPLAPFGNRIPQFSFEVVRPVEGVAAAIRAVCLIPGATEFGYSPGLVTQVLGLGSTRPDNRHQLQRGSDLVASLDALQALCPNLKRVSVVVSWFGDDLRAGACTIAPRVDIPTKATDGDTWSVAGLTRASARPVTTHQGLPAYGGTPSDGAVVRLIQHLKARGLEVVLYPFVMMDIPAGNALPDPQGGPGQPAYPWRGRITCHPAPGRAGSPDGTAEAGAQVAALFDRTDGLRRMVLHCAALAAQAGGVAGFVVGSEFVGLTRVRSAPGTYPAVGALRSLAAAVRGVLPGAKIVYAADWTEYGAHVREGGAEVRFPLDPLFADPAIDAVGIDYYPPVSDWRDGPDHRDLAEARSVYDVAYLRRRLGAGEAFDWFYASETDRAAQTRTPIADGAANKPWIHRAKDLVSWWENPHVERVGGVETATTAWVPRSKPIWLTEIGMPAVDKGANGPNAFPDAKATEANLPPFSSGARDDLMQARGLEAILSRFDPALRGFEEAFNPLSAVYGGRMVDPAAVFVWAWDARPFPAFPDYADVWADGANWAGGHWITGRLEGVTLDGLVRAILRDFGLPAEGAMPFDGFLDGFVVDRPMAARAALEPLARLFGLDVHVSGGAPAWRGRGGRAVLALEASDLVMPEREATLSLARAQETELPHQVEIGFTDGEGEYRRAAVASRRLSGSSRREARADAPVVTHRAHAQRLADAWLQDVWAGRETAEFALSPRRMDVEPGDVVSLPTEAGPKLHRVVRIADGPTRRVTTRAVEPAVFEAPASGSPRPVKRPPAVAGKPQVVVLDLPVATGDPTVLQHIAAAADPWPGAMAVWRLQGGSFRPHRILDWPAMIGRTRTGLPPGPLWRFDPRSVLEVDWSGGALSSVGDEAVLGGDNLFAIQGPDGRWELFGAARAELVGERRYRLSRLLRGLAGSEPEAARTLAPGALVVRLDEAVVPLAADLADLGLAWTTRIGPADGGPAGPAVTETVTTAGPDALKPLSPVAVTAHREPGGIRFAWTRRARREGDPWEPVEVPLGEASEAYELDVVQGGTVLRTLASASPEVLYAAADEISDFGVAQTEIAVRVAQMSATVGRGFASSVTVRVRDGFAPPP